MTNPNLTRPVISLGSSLSKVSNDNSEWLTIRSHKNDESLNEPGSTHTWTFEPPSTTEGWRHVRVKMTGTNNSGSERHLSVSGFEVYGTVISAVESDEFIAKVAAEEKSVEAERAEARAARTMMASGVRVVRGPDWKWGKQDGEPPCKFCDSTKKEKRAEVQSWSSFLQNTDQQIISSIHFYDCCSNRYRLRLNP